MFKFENILMYICYLFTQFLKSFFQFSPKTFKVCIWDPGYNIYNNFFIIITYGFILLVTAFNTLY